MLNHRTAYSDSANETQSLLKLGTSGNRSLDAVSRALGSSLYIIDAVNGIADLDNISRVDDSGSIISEMISNSIKRSGDFTGDTFDEQPLRGFSLRTVYARANEEVIIETMLSKDRLFVNLSGFFGGQRSADVEWSVMQADGHALPEWMNMAGGREIIAQVPDNEEKISLRVVATFPDGSVVQRYVSVNLQTGEMTPLAQPREGRLVPPTFSDMLDDKADLNLQQQLFLGDLLRAG